MTVDMEDIIGQIYCDSALDFDTCGLGADGSSDKVIEDVNGSICLKVDALCIVAERGDFGPATNLSFFKQCVFICS